jgi:ABC-2 type transport system ATP-binding protein
MTNFAIEVENLCKTYRGAFSKGVPALRDVSLAVDRGIIFGLIGQNGAGKTSLAKILLGLSTPTSGSAKVLGGLPGDPHVRRRIGYLPEQMRLPDYFKATNFLAYMGQLNEVNSKVLSQRIPQLLERVGLSGVRKPVKDYSKGMQQRLGLAQALVNDPDILFLDEPTDGLDPLGRKDVRHLLTELREAGKTIFLNSHLLSEIEMVCDRIVILDKGQVKRSATPTEFTQGTGDYIVRLAHANEAARAAAADVLRPMAAYHAEWYAEEIRFRPRDLSQLNALLDALRRVPAEIESVEPVKLSLEQFFLQVVGEEEPQCLPLT